MSYILDPIYISIPYSDNFTFEHHIYNSNSIYTTYAYLPIYTPSAMAIVATQTDFSGNKMTIVATDRKPVFSSNVLSQGN